MFGKCLIIPPLLINFLLYSCLLGCIASLSPCILRGQKRDNSLISQIIMKFIDDICEKIVNPPKLRYSPFDLGPLINAYGKRHDFQLLNLNGLKIQVSFYDNSKSSLKDICVVYLHSMNGSRLQSLVYVQQILKMGLSFCNLDFSGCGNSDGNSISFGANQKNDVKIVVQHLQQKLGVRKVILWGRSMGAACAVKYCQMAEAQSNFIQRSPVIGIILDSCFRSFSKLAVQIGHQNSQIPQFLVKAGYYIIKGTLQQKGKFKVDDLELQQFIGTLNLPALFLASREDTTVSSEHSKILYDLYSHPLKKLTYITGLHNESRDQNFLEQVKQFIGNAIQQDLCKKRLEMLTDFRVNRFQSIKENQRNFVFEGNQTHNETDGCYCSLLPSSNPPPTNQEPLLTRRHRTQYQPGIEKRKSVKLLEKNVQNPYHFRSTKNISAKQYI